MISLRRLRADDSEFLFSWANDAEVIKGSFMRSTPITRDDHVRWFQSKLADSDCYLFIILDSNGDRAGQVRFDLLEGKPHEAIISIGIAPGDRKKGYASEAICQGSEEMFRKHGVQLIHAYIRPENAGSMKSFENAGYTIEHGHKYNGVDVIYAKKSRDNR